MEAALSKCSYSGYFYNYEKKGAYEMFHCEEPPVPNESLCIFHLGKPVPEDEFNSKVVEKIENALNKNSPIFFVGYEFPYLFFIKVLINKNQILLCVGSQPFKKYFLSQSQIYLPNVEAKDHTPHFHVPIYFSNAKFQKGLEITNCHLTSVYFDNASFESDILIAATLMEKSNFVDCKFNGRTNFSMARLMDCNFVNAVFQKEARFIGAILYKSDFFGAKYHAFANFAGAWFNGSSNFNSAYFFEKVTFAGSHFLKPASFIFTNFLSGADFDDTKFIKRIHFVNTIFRNQSETFFNSDLKNVSFKGTNLGRMTFGINVVWNKDFKVVDELDLEWSSKPIFSVRNNKLVGCKRLEDFLLFYDFIPTNSKISFALSDNKVKINLVEPNGNLALIGQIIFSDNEQAFLEMEGQPKYELVKVTKKKWYLKILRKNNLDFYTKKIDPEQVISIYRNLRDNYEFQMKFEQSGKFFIREMDLNRTYKKINRNV